jgi:hypothetical protein
LFFCFDGPKIAIERSRSTEGPLLKEAFDMQDSFSEGSVFYGRTAVLVAAVMAIAILLHLI